MRIEPAVSAWVAVRTKQHGVGEGSRLRALKMALAVFSVSNGTYRSWFARLAYWLAYYGTPRLPPAGDQPGSAP